MMENSAPLSDLNPSVGSTSCPALGTLNRTGWNQDDQPFFWRGDNIWNLDRINPTFFTNLNAVLSYAATKNVIVELTLFDAYNGAYCTSPWHAGNNIGTNDGATNIQFSNRTFFTAFDNDAVNAVDCALSDTTPANQVARKRQVTALQWAVQQLNGKTNFYWQLANEPDESPAASTTTSATALLNWHACMASKIVQAESSLPNKHLIGVNFWTNSSLNALAASANPNIQIVNSHYSTILCNTPGCTSVHTKSFYGAIPLLNGYWSTLPNSTFGFNETKSSTNPSLVIGPRRSLGVPARRRGDLRQLQPQPFRPEHRESDRLSRLHRPVPGAVHPDQLRALGRHGDSRLGDRRAPCLSPGDAVLERDGAAGSARPTGRPRWTRTSTRSISITAGPRPHGAQFKSYAPCYKATGYQNTLSFALGSLPGYYYAEWFAPDQVARPPRSRRCAPTTSTGRARAR